MLRAGLDLASTGEIGAKRCVIVFAESPVEENLLPG